MSLVDVKGVNLVPGIIARPRANPYYAANTIMDANGELCGCVFEVPKTGNISKIGFRTGVVTASDTLKVSLQTVDDTTGRPTGTLIHVDAYGTQGSLSGDTTYWVSLQNPVAVTRDGTPIAIVVEFDSYVGGNLVIAKGIGNFSDTDFPYIFEFVGGAWSLSYYTLNFGFGYDDGVIEQIHSALPAIAFADASWNTNDNPDRRGLRFNVPYNCRISGIFLMSDLDGDTNIEIYDSDGTTLLETISMDANLRGSSGRKVISRNLVTPIELTKDTFYRIAIYPTAAVGNTRLYYLDVTDDGANKAMNAIDGGVNFHYTTCHGSPSAEGDWTQTTTRRPLIGLMLDQLDDGVAVCDFPELSEVQKGVKFDNDTKTGTYIAPVEGLAIASGIAILMGFSGKMISLLSKSSTMSTLTEASSAIKTLLSKGSSI